MQKIDDRYTVHGDQIWGSFTDYVVCIARDIDPIDGSECWSAQFMKGNYEGSEKSPKVYEHLLEDIFKFVNFYTKDQNYGKEDLGFKNLG